MKRRSSIIITTVVEKYLAEVAGTERKKQKWKIMCRKVVKEEKR